MPPTLFNKEAADWAADVRHWNAIEELGGHPLQGPIAQLLNQIDRRQAPRIQFRRLSPVE